MGIHLEVGEIFDPHRYDRLQRRDRLGDYLAPHLEIVAQLCSKTNDRAWEVVCHRCKRRYSVTDSLINHGGITVCGCRRT